MKRMMVLIVRKRSKQVPIWILIIDDQTCKVINGMTSSSKCCFTLKWAWDFSRKKKSLDYVKGMTILLFGSSIFFRGAQTKGLMDCAIYLQDILKDKLCVFQSIIRSKNFDTFRILSFNHFWKVKVNMQYFRTRLRKRDPTMMSEIINKYNKVHQNQF